MAKGFCTCRRDFPGRYPLPEGATWHYLCDKPIRPAEWDKPVVVATGTGWPGGAR